MTLKKSNSLSPIQEFRREAESLFESYRQDGLWTHAFGAWGQLNHSGKTVVIEILPEKRDIFDLASLTKAIVTSCLIYREFHLNMAKPSTTLGEWLGASWPCRLHPSFKEVTLENLLGHTSGLPSWINFWINHWCPDGQTKHSREIPGLTDIERHLHGLNRVRVVPKSGELYSDLGFILLGLGLGLKYKKSLDVQWNQWLSQELNLSEEGGSLSFCPSLAIRDRCVPTSYCTLRKRLLVGEVHDENCASLGGVAGHAGLFGSGESLIAFLRNLFDSQMGNAMFLENQRRLESRFVEAKSFVSSPTPLLGWRAADDPSSEVFGRGRALGHMGFTGVAFWVRPKQNDFAILLTNRISSGRVNRKIARFRQEFFELASALV